MTTSSTDLPDFFSRDLLIVLRDEADGGGLEERVRDLAYDVELEYGWCSRVSY